MTTGSSSGESAIEKKPGGQQLHSSEVRADNGLGLELIMG